MNTSDRTVLAIRRQLTGMRINQYEIGILRTNGAMLLREWSKKQLLLSVGWLKRENSGGSNIYIRPKGSQGLILVDDLNQANIKKLCSNGLAPACEIETSPLNFQVWIRVCFDGLSESTATQCARYLADQYEGDPNSADWRHFGRLAGFTNKKPHYVNEIGHYPFVLAHQSSGAMIADTNALLNDVAAWIKIRENERAIKARRGAVSFSSPVAPAIKQDAITCYRSQFHGLLARYGKQIDMSRADWMIAQYMARRGYTHTMICTAMEATSMGIYERKVGHISHYIKMTVDKVFEQLQADLIEEE